MPLPPRNPSPTPCRPERRKQTWEPHYHRFSGADGIGTTQRQSRDQARDREFTFPDGNDHHMVEKKEPNALIRLASAQARVPAPEPKVLDEKQELFLTWILVPETDRNPRTLVAYAELHDISLASLKRWRNLPHFRARYEKFVKENIATPERIQMATDYAYNMAYGGSLSPAEAIKWANHWADLAGLKKIEPIVQKSAAETLAESSDEELEAMYAEVVANELKRRQSS